MAKLFPPHIARKLQTVIDRVDWDLVERADKRYKAAIKENPAWQVLGDLTFRQLAEIMHRLPGAPGRPKGTGPIATDAELLAELTACTERGEKPTPAAMELLRKRGVGEAGLKNRADHLVRLWKREKTKPGF